MNETPVYTVRTHATGPVTGSDSCVTPAPPGLYATAGGVEVLKVRELGVVLRRISEEQAANLGEGLHHAEWRITADPEVVRRYGIHNPRCVTCQAGVDQALARLAERPGEELLVGVLYWATPAAVRRRRRRG